MRITPKNPPTRSCGLKPYFAYRVESEHEAIPFAQGDVVVFKREMDATRDGHNAYIFSSPEHVVIEDRISEDAPDSHMTRRRLVGDFETVIRGDYSDGVFGGHRPQWCRAGPRVPSAVPQLPGAYHTKGVDARQRPSGVPRGP